MKPVDKLVINYLRNKFKIPHDVVIDVKSDPSSSIKTMNFKFDLTKTDVNSGESEEWYQNFFLKPKRLTGMHSFLQNAIKQTDFPNVTMEFSKDSDPDIKITFRGFTKEQFEDKDMFKEFTRQLKDVLGNEVDLSPYMLSHIVPR